MKRKKIAIIGTAGLPANYGGFETMTDYLTKQKNQDFDFSVFCGKTSKNDQIKSYNGARLIYLPLKANGAQSIAYDVLSILKSWFNYDSLIILGTGGSFILPFLKLFKKTKTIVNFGGLEWKRDKWPWYVLKYLKLTESIAIKHATHIVADNQYFCDYILKEYKVKAKLIEYGGDHVSFRPITKNLEHEYPFLKDKYAVSVSRAQPDNNLHLLLEAYAKCPQHNLALVSNWDKFEYGRKLKKQYKEYSNIFMVDAVYDLEILDVIRSNALIYIHSHTFCGTAPSLVEAMNLSLPIIAYDVATNHMTTENKALFFKDVEGLIDILRNLSEEQIRENGQKMYEIANRRYTWNRISDNYAKLF